MEHRVPKSATMPAYNLGAKGYPHEVHNGQGESYPLGCSSHCCQRDYGKKHHRLLQRKECPCVGNNRKKLTPEILERIEEVIEDCPATTLKQIKRRLKENQVLRSNSTIFNWYAEPKIMLKKCHFEIAPLHSANYGLNMIVNQTTASVEQTFINWIRQFVSFFGSL